jgi:SET domain-containing protein
MEIIEETDNRFYIAKSTLPNAGFGVFAKEAIKKDDWLEVIGVMVKKGGIADQCTNYASKYKFASSKFDAKIIPIGYAGIINHTTDPILQNMDLVRVKGLRKRSPHASEIIYKAIRDIEPGEELLGNYGEQIGQEIEKVSEWETFLDYNLYNLKTLIDNL